MKQNSGFVYLIRHPDGFYKVGKSQNPARRLNKLAAGTPYELEIDRVINTNKSEEIEKRLHDSIEEHKHKREWFDITRGELMDVVASELKKLGNHKASVYKKEVHNSLFNPPKPDVIEEGSILYINYTGHTSTEVTKMVKVKDVDYGIGDEFKINDLEITLTAMHEDSCRPLQLTQTRGGHMTLKTHTSNSDKPRDVSENVKITAFERLSLDSGLANSPNA